MAIRLMGFSSITLALVALTSLAAPRALGQETRPLTLPEAMGELASTYSQDYFRNRSMGRQVGRIFGFGFPERELEWDAHALSVASRDAMYRQNSMDPTLRVPDLTNPYTTSLLTMTGTGSASVGTQFIFEGR